MSTTHPRSQTDFDAVIIGAGFAGLYQLHRLREQGLKVRVFEAANGVGGTWHWNRYPGARTDSPSHIYQYLFSDDLLDQWNWSERYAAQPETERYLNWAADKLDLRRDISLESRVASAYWDKDLLHWTVRTVAGEEVSSRFLISCMGALAAPVIPQFEDQETFTGQIVHTARWPSEGVNLRDKRVAVVGTGATGIQVIQTIAPQVAELTVFQRTPNYAVPMRNPQYGDADRQALRSRYPELRRSIWHTFGGFDFDLDPRNWSDVSTSQRLETLERLWKDGSLAFWVGSFKEALFDPAINEEVSEFVRNKIRPRIRDPKVAAKLLPSDHGFGTRRVPLETGYFETFNRDNVKLVDTRAEPITRITPAGIRTADLEYPFDTIILATGFDAGTGAVTQIDIRGRESRSLRELWYQDLRTAMGMQVHGFPNLFLTSSPLSPAAAFCNAPTCIQHSVEWISDCIEHVLSRGASTVEATAAFEADWVAHHDQIAGMTLIGKTASWYTGANVEGKPRRLIGYPGVGNYRMACEREKAAGYPGFAVA